MLGAVSEMQQPEILSDRSQPISVTDSELTIVADHDPSQSPPSLQEKPNHHHRVTPESSITFVYNFN